MRILKNNNKNLQKIPFPRFHQISLPNQAKACAPFGRHHTIFRPEKRDVGIIELNDLMSDSRPHASIYICQ